MKKRSVAVVIILSLVTFGIYYMVWVYKTRKEMVARGHAVPTFWLLFAPVLALVAVGVLQFLMRFVLSQSASMDSGPNTALYNGVSILSSLVGLIALLSFIPATIYFFYKYSQAVEAVTKGATSFGFTFGLWAVLSLLSVPFVWPGLVQDGFNKIPGGTPGDFRNPSTGSIPPVPGQYPPTAGSAQPPLA